MAAITRPEVLSTNPVDGATDISVTTTITASFSEQMDPDTINSTNILVFAPDYETISGTVTYDQVTYTAYFTPSVSLPYGKEIKVIIVGDINDADDLNTGVKDIYGNTMSGNFSWTFTTAGSGVDEPDYPTEGETDDGETAADITYMSVVSTDPKNYDTNLDPDLLGVITINFNDNIATKDLENYVTVENGHVLGDPAYEYDSVEYDLTSSGPVLTITPSGYEEANEYLITILAGISGAAAYPMTTDYSFMFTTKMSPMYSSSKIVRLNIGPFIKSVPDDTLNRLIYENSLLAANLSSSAIPSGNVPYYVKQYVTCKSKLDALDAAQLQRSASAGVRKRLADFSIEFDDRNRSLAPIRNKFEKCVEEMEKLLTTGGYGTSFVPFQIGKYSSRRPTWRRYPFKERVDRPDVTDVDFSEY